MKSNNSSKEEQKDKKLNNSERLAEALRQNLRKRKEFQRKQNKED